MTCYHPLHGWRSSVSGSSGKRGLTFKSSEGYRDLPVTVPCGQCIGCRVERTRQWSQRLMDEARFHTQMAFVTFTYSPENLPPGSTLVKEHVQGFFKRLRARLEYEWRCDPNRDSQAKPKIRFFACGEYGENFDRPHYHAIIYGCDFPDRRKHSVKDGNTLYVSDLLDEIWGLGHCWIGTVTDHSCRYVAEYVIKKITGERAAEHYRRLDPFTGEVFDLVPEFILMSRRPGIGHAFYERFKSDMYPSDFVVNHSGKTLSVPKFYDRRLEADDPKLLQKLKSRRVGKAARRKADNTPERLAVRKTVALAKLSQKKRVF